ncbi:hypothetical protein C8046_17660 [Serinibacter arcticus]|uniref:DUF8094 domain-containing protein n=1 Tax=Serinibacter arcticus TaxID=1655435 RepID=A0A2U1ZZ03_9MICO|nr:hypothetical protein [Serinibacter arcticus]PWD52194.1 hypothetical protein C8046_17660 [Serinibacter arcticus]
MTPRRRRLSAAGAVLATSLLLAGCAEEVAPTLVAEPPPEFAPPAVSEERAQEVLDEVEDQIAAADAAGDIEQMRARVVAPAIDFRATQYALNTATGGADVPLPLTTDSDVFVVTATDSWPRSILAVSNPGEGSTVRLYLGLTQNSPREDYQLVSWSRLLPGVETPVFATAEIGSAPVTADQEGLLATPADALTRLAAVLTDPADPASAEFEEDPFRPFLTAELDGLRQSVQVAGEVSSASTPGAPVFAIATADGGALVMGTVDSTVTLRKTIEGAELTLGGQIAALGGAEPVEAAAVATYQQMVTVYIPPAGGEQTQMRLLGVDRVLASVTRTE